MKSFRLVIVVAVVVGTCLKRLRAHEAGKSPVSFVLIYAPPPLDLTLVDFICAQEACRQARKVT